MAYCIRPKAAPDADTQSGRLLDRFLRDDRGDFRKKRLKMIPCVSRGPWVVKKLVGSKVRWRESQSQVLMSETFLMLKIAIIARHNRPEGPSIVLRQ